jgi:hypothetical protein
MVLLAEWGALSDDLTRDAMLFDAFCHDDPMVFDAWASGGPCPYANRRFQRAVNFREKRHLWRCGDPPPAYILMERILREKCRQ